VAAVNSKKRATPVVEEVDLDEQERRRKRAERFGNPVVVRFPKLSDDSQLFTQTWRRVQRLDIPHFSSHCIY
jgi:hypothetical protein